MLFGQIEVQEAPQIAQFEDAITRDSEVPCWVKAAMPRLYRVALDDKMRVTVWKRMCRQELYIVDRKLLQHIETIAMACNMPLSSGRFRNS